MDHVFVFITGGRGNKEKSKNFKNLLNSRYPKKYRIDIIDVLENPQAAHDNQIFATPTILTTASGASKKAVGDIGDPEKIISLLGLI